MLDTFWKIDYIANPVVGENSCLSCFRLSAPTMCTLRMESVVRKSHFKLALLAATVAVFCSPLVVSAFPKISAQKGKKYKLTPKHGPWMIMVASFSLPEKQFRDTKGLTPQEAAHELVHELRKKGIPAYTYSSDWKVDRFKTYNRNREISRRVIRAQKGAICVLAGNYKSNKDAVGHKTLSWIENNFSPKLLSGDIATDGRVSKLKNGGVFRSTGGSPLKGAFLTVNPLLTTEDARKHFKSPLLAKLNPRGKCSIRNNKGKQTLIVASFYGKSMTSVGKSGYERSKIKLDKKSGLSIAKNEAWILANHMRSVGFDAYVYHDRYKSVVTVGAFDKSDKTQIPAIRKEAKRFGAKMRWNQKNRQVLTAEVITLPFKPTVKNPMRKKWLFDPQPRVMDVPNL